MENKDFIKTFCKNFDLKMMVLRDEETELYQIVENEEKSQSFFKKNIKKMRQQYYSAKKTRIDLD